MLRNQNTRSNDEAQMSLGLNGLTEETYTPDPDYQAGATVHSVSSRGQMRRVKSRTTGRIVYLLSLLEYIVFIILDLDPQVIDIEEQREHDLQHTLRKAFELGINHPPQASKEKTELTTDFVVTLAGSPIRKVGIYVKYMQELDNDRTIEKLQLERASLEQESIPLYVVTEEEIDRKTHLTLEWIIGASIDDCNIEELRSHADSIKRMFTQNPERRLSEALVDLDEEIGVSGGTSLYRFKQLVQLGVFCFEFDKDFHELCGQDIETVNEVIHV